MLQHGSSICHKVSPIYEGNLQLGCKYNFWQKKDLDMIVEIWIWICICGEKKIYSFNLTTINGQGAWD